MTEKQERRSVRRIDCFNRAILNDEVEHSLVVDINSEGAGLLLLKDQSLFKSDAAAGRADISGNVRLTIFHPDMPVQDGICVDAEVIWVDYEYADDRNKIGVKFVGMVDKQVGGLSEWLSRDGNYYFHCELEKCSVTESNNDSSHL